MKPITTAEVIELVTSALGPAAGAAMDETQRDFTDIESANEDEISMRLLEAARAIIKARKAGKENKSGYVSADLFAELESAANEWEE